MDLFVKRFQPEQYDDWISGRYNSAPVAQREGAWTTKPTLPDCSTSSDSAAVCKTNQPTPKRQRTASGTSLRPPAVIEAKSTFAVSDPDDAEVSQLFDSGDTPDAGRERDNESINFDFSFVHGPNSPGWTRPLRKLWQWVMFNFHEERSFNHTRSLKEPHCAVCQFFVPSSLSQTRGTVPVSSRRILRNACFAAWPSSVKLRQRTEASGCAENHNQEPLYQCSCCLVTVHPSCYGIGIVEETCSSGSWFCRRCSAVDPFGECRLCCLRGGALVPTVDMGWCHVVCSLMIPTAVEIKPGSDVLRVRRPVSPKACYHCSSHSGAVILCSQNNCDRRFHVTCGYEAGCHFEFRDWPVLMSAICTKHNLPSGVEKTVLEVNDKVWAPLPFHTADGDDPTFEQGTVIAVTKQTFCVVDFEDGTFSNNAFPTDIEWCNCAPDCGGAHLVGAKVKLRWTDKEVYDATFRRAYSTDAYTVQFDVTANSPIPGRDDSSLESSVGKSVSTEALQNVCTREDIFVETDKAIPQHVLCAMQAKKPVATLSITN